MNAITYQLLHSHKCRVRCPFGRQVMSCVYLITLSHAERTTMESKRHFAHLIEESFNFCFGPKTVLFWAAAKEAHAEGGFHYHVCVRLAKGQRFNRPLKMMREKGIQPHFAEGRGLEGYFGAYQYVKKEDPEVEHSAEHPQSIAEPRTRPANRARREKAREKRCKFISREVGEGEGQEGQAKEKEVKLSKKEVGDIVLEKGIRSFKELIVEAETRRRAGDETLSTFVLNRGRKVAEETVELANLLAGSIEEVQLSQRTRMKVVEGATIFTSHFNVLSWGGGGQKFSFFQSACNENALARNLAYGRS